MGVAPHIFTFCLIIMALEGSGLLQSDHEFLHSIMLHFSRKAIAFHVPPMKAQEIIQFHKKSDEKDDTCYPTSYHLQSQSNDTKNHFKPVQEELHVFMIDSEQIDQSINVLKHFITQRSWSNQEHWLIDISAFGSIESATNSLNDLALDLDDDVFFVRFINDMAYIWEAYKIHPSKDLIMAPIGTWTKTSGLSMTPFEKWQRRRNLQGFKFKCVSLESVPYITELTPSETDSNLYEVKGMFAEVFENLKDVMNFTYEMTRSIDGNWGGLQSDDTWDGMVGMLTRNEVDIAVTDFTVFFERSLVIDLTDAVASQHHSFFIKNPADAFNYSAYTATLDQMTWFMIMAMMVLAPPFLYFAVKNDKIARKEFTLGKCYVYICSALTMRSWSVVPSQWSGKIAFFSLLGFSTMIYFHWEAMLISFLATRVIVLPFENLNELMSETNNRILIAPASYYQVVFEKSTDQLWQSAWTDRIRPYLDELKGLQQADELIEILMSDSSAALYFDHTSLTSFQQYADCEIIDTPKKYDSKSLAYGLQKDSPFLAIFNYYLKEMNEKGSLEQIIKKYRPKPQVCQDYSGKALKASMVFTAFLVLCLGIVLSMILLGIEIFGNILGFNVSCYDDGLKEEFEEQEIDALKQENEFFKYLLSLR